MSYNISDPTADDYGYSEQITDQSWAASYAARLFGDLEERIDELEARYDTELENLGNQVDALELRV